MSKELAESEHSEPRVIDVQNRPRSLKGFVFGQKCIRYLSTSLMTNRIDFHENTPSKPEDVGFLSSLYGIGFMAANVPGGFLLPLIGSKQLGMKEGRKLDGRRALAEDVEEELFVLFVILGAAFWWPARWSCFRLVSAS